MSRQRFPINSDQPGATLYTFTIDGSEVGATAATDGLNGRGKNLCTILKSTNRVTIAWLVSFAEAPVPTFQMGAGQTDTIVEIVSSSATALVFDTVKATDNSGTNDADLIVQVIGYKTTSYVS